MEPSEKMQGKIGKLIENNYETQKGFQSAAAQVKNKKLKAFFEQKAEERKLFIKELREEISSKGRDASELAKSKGDLQNSWMDLRAALEIDKDEAVLEESLKGEKAALRDYKAINTEEDLPSPLSNKLKRQQKNIQGSINNVRMYEQMFD